MASDALDTVRNMTMKWINTSLAVRSGKISAEEAVKKYDQYIVPIAMIIGMGIASGAIDPVDTP